MKKLILLAVITSALFSSCQKNNSPGPDAKNVPGGLSAKSRPALTTDVYIAGDAQLLSGVTTPTTVAYYWKNAVAVQLLTSGTGNSHAQAVAVSGTDVYVAGYANGPDAFFSVGANPGSPCIWKNGVEQILPIPAGHIGAAQAIAISGSDVYVVGYYITNDATHSRRAMLWKNGVALLLAFNTFDSIATGIALDGTDVYVCGNAVFSGVTCAVYWKNNIWHPFAGTAVTSRAAAITVDALHNYYISGASNGAACYWKDANLVALPNDGYFPETQTDDKTFGNMISVDNNNVYVSGFSRAFESDHVVLTNAYWKNGVEVPIPLPPNLGDMDAGALYSIVVINNAVYGGVLTDSSGGPYLWGYYANGTYVSVGTPTYIGGTAVVQH